MRYERSGVIRETSAQRVRVQNHLIFMVCMILMVLILNGVTPAAAQDVTPIPETAPLPTLDPNNYTMRVFVDSAFIRVLPDFDAQPVGSVFENSNLLAVGRNVDGTWFEVRRPGQNENAGWISREVVLYSFDVSDLPMTDLTTGVDGTEPVYDTGYSTFILSEATLHVRPARDAEQIGILPIQLILPVLDRTPDNQWLRVNYRGMVGWVAEFLTRPKQSSTDIPVNQAYTVGYLPIEVIPLEVQLEQVARFREYVTPILEQSEGLSSFWGLVSSGQIVPCDPVAGDYTFYAVTPRDIVELPELRNQERLVRQAITSINNSIEAMQHCGIYLPDELTSAYAQAINARGILRVVVIYLDNLESTLISR